MEEVRFELDLERVSEDLDGWEKRGYIKRENSSHREE